MFLFLIFKQAHETSFLMHRFSFQLSVDVNKFTFSTIFFFYLFVQTYYIVKFFSQYYFAVDFRIFKIFLYVAIIAFLSIRCSETTLHHCTWTTDGASARLSTTRCPSWRRCTSAAFSGTPLSPPSSGAVPT